MTKPRDYTYEALAAATQTDMEAGRGELNAALKSIRGQEPELTDYALADEVHRRAKVYPEAVGDVTLTASALAKHWRRCAEAPKRERMTNQHAGRSGCETCEGDGFVLFEVREKGADVMAPCPKCNHADYSYWRYDGTRFRLPDPALVTEYLSR